MKKQVWRGTRAWVVQACYMYGWALRQHEEPADARMGWSMKKKWLFRKALLEGSHSPFAIGGPYS